MQRVVHVTVVQRHMTQPFRCSRSIYVLQGEILRPSPPTSRRSSFLVLGFVAERLLQSTEYDLFRNVIGSCFYQRSWSSWCVAGWGFWRLMAFEFSSVTRNGEIPTYSRCSRSIVFASLVSDWSWNTSVFVHHRFSLHANRISLYFQPTQSAKKHLNPWDVHWFGLLLYLHAKVCAAEYFLQL